MMDSGSVPSHTIPPATFNPNETEWMSKQGFVISCPPGLEYFASLDQLQVLRQADIWTSTESKISYAVKNDFGQQCYSAYEESDIHQRMQYRNMRDFDLNILDKTGQEVVRAHRESKGCCVGCVCSSCCVNEESHSTIITVESPVGTYIGRIIQLPSKWTQYAIQDSNNQTLLVIKAPPCTCSGPCSEPEDERFSILTVEESAQIGSITHLHNGLATEMLTNASCFDIKFPMDLDAKVKALLLCATLFLDIFMFGQNHRPRRRY